MLDETDDDDDSGGDGVLGTGAVSGGFGFWHTQGWWALVFAAAAVLFGGGHLTAPASAG